MNYVKLLGHFCEIHAHTDTTVDIVEREDWVHKDGYFKDGEFIQQGYYRAMFLTSDGVWIEVRVKVSYFEYWYSHYVEGREVVQVEGHLGVEVGRGAGITQHFVAVGF